MNDLVVTEKPLQWVHYSGDPTEIVMFDAYEKVDDRTGPFGRDDFTYFKPRGLWITPYGQDDNWYEWCQSEDFRKAELNFTHEVNFSKEANILNISSVDGLDAFSMEYAMDTFAGLGLTHSHNKEPMESWMYCDWPRLAKKYDGILISPYQYGRRLMRFNEGGKKTRTDWYYTWDCASGCIWNAKAIESIKLRSTVSAGYVSKPPPDIKKMMSDLEKFKKDTA